MITEIETALLTVITQQISAVGSSGIQKDARGKLINPAVVVAVVEGGFARLGQVNWKQELTVMVMVQFKHLKGETERRHGANPLVQALVQLLINRVPVTGCAPLAPKRWRETTTEEQYNAGLIEYVIELATSYIVTPATDETLADLMTLGLNYYLHPDDDIRDAQDILTFAGTPEPPTPPADYALVAYLDGSPVAGLVELLGVAADGTIAVKVNWPETIRGGEL